METVTTPEALQTHLDRLDIKLWLDGERLRYSALPGALTPDLRALLQAHKSGLMVLLRNRQSKNRLGIGVVTAPPSFVQRHFWSLQQLNPTDCFFNVPYAFHLQGTLDATLLRRSFDEIIHRHELLRTTLQTIDGALRQVVAPTGEVDMSVADLRDRPPATRADEADRLIQAELRSPFDLGSETCLRVRLVRLREEEHILFLCLHNMICEDGSLGALLKEVRVHYQAFLAAPPGQKPAPLPPLPMQYADFARWQQSLLSTGMQDRLAYWRQWFAKGEPPPWTPTCAKPAPAAPTFRAGTVWLRFSSELTLQIKRLSRRAAVTLFVTTLAAYAALLYRYSGCTDVVVGGPAVNRSHWKLEPLIGSTLNIIAYRFDVAGNPDVLTLLARVRETVLAALTHQDAPFAVVAPLLEPERKRSNPLFRTVLSFFEDPPHHQLHLPGITVTFLEKITNREIRPDLFPVMWDEPVADGALTGYWMYKEDLFDADTMTQMLADYEALLTAMADDPAQTIDALPLGQRVC